MLVANVSPSSERRNDTCLTLNFASRAKCVRCVVTPAEPMPQSREHLEAEVRKLRGQLNHYMSRESSVRSLAATHIESTRDQYAFRREVVNLSPAGTSPFCGAGGTVDIGGYVTDSCSSEGEDAQNIGKNRGYREPVGIERVASRAKVHRNEVVTHVGPGTTSSRTKLASGGSVASSVVSFASASCDTLAYISAERSQVSPNRGKNNEFWARDPATHRVASRCAVSEPLLGRRRRTTCQRFQPSAVACYLAFCAACFLAVGIIREPLFAFKRGAPLGDFVPLGSR